MTEDIIIYYTPQSILDMIIIDPALGIGGFLADIYAELNQQDAAGGGGREGEAL